MLRVSYAVFQCLRRLSSVSELYPLTASGHRARTQAFDAQSNQPYPETPPRDLQEILRVVPQAALAQDMDGLCPLDLAARNPQCKPDTIRLLVQAGGAALDPEVISVDLEKEWARLNTYVDLSGLGENVSGMFGLGLGGLGLQTMASKQAALLLREPDGVSSLSFDDVVGYRAEATHSDVVFGTAHSLIVALVFQVLSLFPPNAVSDSELGLENTRWSSSSDSACAN